MQETLITQALTGFYLIKTKLNSFIIRQEIQEQAMLFLIVLRIWVIGRLLVAEIWWQ